MFDVRGCAMASIGQFEDIRAWQKARELVREVYKIYATTRLGRDFELRNQICGAAVSVMSNIAEGFSRNSSKEFARFLDIARGSCSEVKSLLYVAVDVEYLSQPDFELLFGLATTVASLIAGFTSYLRSPRNIERRTSNAERPTSNLEHRTPNIEQFRGA
jgi:four helix bundle protein